MYIYLQNEMLILHNLRLQSMLQSSNQNNLQQRQGTFSSTYVILSHTQNSYIHIFSSRFCARNIFCASEKLHRNIFYAQFCARQIFWWQTDVRQIFFCSIDYARAVFFSQQRDFTQIFFFNFSTCQYVIFVETVPSILQQVLF